MKKRLATKFRETIIGSGSVDDGRANARTHSSHHIGWPVWWRHRFFPFPPSFTTSHTANQACSVTASCVLLKILDAIWLCETSNLYNPFYIISEFFFFFLHRNANCCFIFVVIYSPSSFFSFESYSQCVCRVS